MLFPNLDAMCVPTGREYANRDLASVFEQQKKKKPEKKTNKQYSVQWVPKA